MKLAACLPLLAVALLAAALPASAQPVPYPHKLVTLVTHSSPGGGSDVFLREMVKVLPRYIDATFIVDNVQGGSGARAMSKMATAKPDGALLYAITPTYVYTSLLSKIPHGYKDLEPLVIVFADAEVLYTRADGPYQTLKDVVERARTARGRWGVASPASLERQVAERLKRAAGVNAAIVSHDGGGDMMINVLNGTLDAGVGEIQELRSQIEGKKVRLLGTFNGARLPSVPELATVKEQGFDVVAEKFRGLAGPKGLSAEIAAAWEVAVPRMLADPAYRKTYEGESLVPDFRGRTAAGKLVAEFGAASEAFLKETGAIK